MQARVMMLQSDEQGNRFCTYAEEVLHEVAGAFGHSLSIRLDKIGEASAAAYGTSLTEETVAACRRCDAVFCGRSGCEGLDDLADELGAGVTVRYCGVPQAICGRHEKGFFMALATARALDEEGVRCAAAAAFEWTACQEAALTHVPPSGKSADGWRTEVGVQALGHTSVPVREADAPDAMTKLIETPSQLGVLLVSPYAGSIFSAAAVALNTVPQLMYDVRLGGEAKVFAPVLPADGEDCPLGALLAVSDMLRCALRWKREADCLNAAIINILEAGWRTEGMTVPGNNVTTAPEMVRLVCEQVALVGRLMGHEGGVLL